jgi:hypothetical protein
MTCVLRRIGCVALSLTSTMMSVELFHRFRPVADPGFCKEAIIDKKHFLRLIRDT